MKKVLFLLMFLSVLGLGQVSAQTKQGGLPPRNPKMMTERLAKDLNFSGAQNQQLAELNKKNEGDDYDRKGYMDAFKKILTAEQHQQLQEMRQKRMGSKRRGGAN